MTEVSEGVQKTPILRAQHPIDHPFTKGTAINLGVAPLGAGSSASADLDTSGYAVLMLLARVGNGTTPAGAAADCNPFIQPYEADQIAKFLTAITKSSANFLTGGIAYKAMSFDLCGLDKVSIAVNNANAGALQGARLDYFLQK